jgi:flagellar motor component MotA
MDNNENLSANDLFQKVMEIARKYDGKSANEILKAIYEEAEKGKKNGTLSISVPFMDSVT